MLDHELDGRPHVKVLDWNENEDDLIFVSTDNHVNIPVTFSHVSTDQKTVTVQVNGTLTGSTQYRMGVYLHANPVSLPGVFDYSQRQFPFTTEP
jgi:hypothetical protein